MKHQHEPIADEFGINEEAADWLLRIQDGLSQAEFRDWRRWLDVDPAHAEAFDAVSRILRISDPDFELPWPDDAELAHDTYAGDVPIEPPPVQPENVSQRRIGRRSWLAIAASLIGVLTTGIIALQWPQPADVLYETGTAEHRTVELEDGSRITVGAQSSITVAYSNAERQITLAAGEAYFRVAKDAKRPFVVNAGERSVRALGTEFDVNIGVRDIRVAVVEGTVRVDGPGYGSGPETGMPVAATSVELGSGDVVDFGVQNGSPSVNRSDARLSASWMSGRLAYDGVPLESVIADVNRYSQNEVIIGDDSTRQLPFTGTVFSDDIDDWLTGLEEVFPLRVVPIGDNRIVLVHESD